MTPEQLRQARREQLLRDVRLKLDRVRATSEAARAADLRGYDRIQAELTRIRRSSEATLARIRAAR